MRIKAICVATLILLAPNTYAKLGENLAQIKSSESSRLTVCYGHHFTHCIDLVKIKTQHKMEMSRNLAPAKSKNITREVFISKIDSFEKIFDYKINPKLKYNCLDTVQIKIKSKTADKSWVTCEAFMPKAKQAEMYRWLASVATQIPR